MRLLDALYTLVVKRIVLNVIALSKSSWLKLKDYALNKKDLKPNVLKLRD
jgi:hypothetical protein